METKSHKKSWERRLLYPTAGDFDDLFYKGKPVVDKKQPEGWAKNWVIDVEDTETGLLKLGNVQIGPYCHINNGGGALWVKVREHLVENIKKSMPSNKSGTIFFEIIHPANNKFAAVFAKYNGTGKRKPLARIKWESVPYQAAPVSDPS